MLALRTGGGNSILGPRIFPGCAWLGVLVLASAGSLSAPAYAANPHLVSAEPTISDPIVSPGHLTYDTSLDVPFKVAGRAFWSFMSGGV